MTTGGEIFCTSCGAQNRTQNGFCTVCGVALISVKTPQVKKIPVVVPSAAPSVAPSAAPKVAPSAAPAVSKKKSSSKPKRTQLIKNSMFIVGAVLLGFVAGVAMTSSNVFSGVFGERFGSYSSGYDAGEASVLELSACARGESCVVGDTGPGGGIVFYVSETNFKSIGSDCNLACKYLEAAPSDNPVTLPWSTSVAACYPAGYSTGSSDCEMNSIYTGSRQDSARAASTAIGAGMTNTNDLYARLTTEGGVAPSEYAAGFSWSFENNGKTDWHLPSKDELLLLCKWANNNPVSSDMTTCSGGSVNTGKGAAGFIADDYFSSSENDNPFSWICFFGNGDQSNGKKSGRVNSRTVRAFG